MEIVVEHDGLLTNIEVLDHLRKRQQHRQVHQPTASTDGAVDGVVPRDSSDRDWIEQKVTEYLTADEEAPAGSMTPETAQHILTQLETDSAVARRPRRNTPTSCADQSAEASSNKSMQTDRPIPACHPT